MLVVNSSRAFLHLQMTVPLNLNRFLLTSHKHVNNLFELLQLDSPHTVVDLFEDTNIHNSVPCDNAENVSNNLKHFANKTGQPISFVLLVTCLGPLLLNKILTWLQSQTI